MDKQKQNYLIIFFMLRDYKIFIRYILMAIMKRELRMQLIKSRVDYLKKT